MTIETTVSKAQFLGDGAARIFPLPFPVAEPNHARLIITDIASGIETPVHADYEVIDCGTGRVSVTYPVIGEKPLATGKRLTIYRELPLTQDMDLAALSDFNAEVIEGNFDKTTMQIQQLAEHMSRAVAVSIGDIQTPEDLRDGLFASAGAAAQSAAQSAASAQAAANDRLTCADSLALAQAAALAASGCAQTAAQSAAEAACTATQGLPQATESITGITRYGTAAEHTAKAANVAATPAHVQSMIDTASASVSAAASAACSVAVQAEATARADADAALQTSLTTALSKLSAFAAGDVTLKPFRATELPAKWYFCNGDRFLLSSPQGQALAALSAHYKADWGITTDATSINVPHLFCADGRGYFVRCVNGVARQVGSAEQDDFKLHNHSGNAGAGYAGSGFVAGSGWQLGGVGSTGGAETRPLNIGMTPAIYLGV